MERQKKAQEFHKEQDRLAKIEERKKAKLEKQKEMAAQLEKFQKSMKELSGQYETSDEEDDEDEDEDKKIDVEEEYEEWDGFQEGEEDQNESKSKGILKRIYAANIGGSDEDGTEVTIEDVEFNNNLEEIAKLNYVNLQKSQKILEESIDRAKKYAVIAGAAPKKSIQKKKKFRYLTKSERRANNRKAIDKKKKSRNRD